MLKSNTHLTNNAVPLGMALLFSNLLKTGLAIGIFILPMLSCENDMRRVDELTSISNLPDLEMKGMNMEYTEKGRLSIRVESDLAEIFSGKDEHYNFPLGVKLSTFGEDASGQIVETSAMEADSAVYYKGTHLEAFGNIHLTGEDGVILQTNFITWDEQKRWISTTDTVHIIKNGLKKTSIGLEARDDFSYYKLINLTGIISIDAEQTD